MFRWKDDALRYSDPNCDACAGNMFVEAADGTLVGCKPCTAACTAGAMMVAGKVPRGIAWWEHETTPQDGRAVMALLRGGAHVVPSARHAAALVYGAARAGSMLDAVRFVDLVRYRQSGARIPSRTKVVAVLGVERPDRSSTGWRDSQFQEVVARAYHAQAGLVVATRMPRAALLKFAGPNGSSRLHAMFAITDEAIR